MATEEDRLQLQVALPGLSREDVEITTVGRTLRIRASRKEGKSNFTDYEQQLLLPDYVDTDRVTATMRHGLLEISMPYKEALKPKRIEIASEAPEQKRLNAAA
jgi:HSP20 family protein